MRDKKRVKRHFCEVCGEYGVTHIHHIFGGRQRRISEREDFVIELCPKCHEKAHNDREFSLALKHDCQLQFMFIHSLDEWMDLMGKDYMRGDEISCYSDQPKKHSSLLGPQRFED